MNTLINLKRFFYIDLVFYVIFEVYQDFFFYKRLDNFSLDILYNKINTAHIDHKYAITGVSPHDLTFTV